MQLRSVDVPPRELVDLIKAYGLVCFDLPDHHRPHARGREQSPEPNSRDDYNGWATRQDRPSGIEGFIKAMELRLDGRYTLSPARSKEQRRRPRPAWRGTTTSREPLATLGERLACVNVAKVAVFPAVAPVLPPSHDAVVTSGPREAEVEEPREKS